MHCNMAVPVLLLAASTFALPATQLGQNLSMVDSLRQIDDELQDLMQHLAVMESKAEKADEDAKQEAQLQAIATIKSSIDTLGERLDEIANTSDVQEIKASVAGLEEHYTGTEDTLKKLKQSVAHLVNQTKALNKATQARLHPPAECADLQLANPKDDVYPIYPYGNEQLPVKVYCVFNKAGRNWTVFQRRYNGKLSFYHDWTGYRKGFGSVDGEHWLGNDLIHTLTNSPRHLLRVEIEDFSGVTKWAQYNSFSMDDEVHGYALHVCCYQGTAGDSLIIAHNNQKFSTSDFDHDVNERINCGEKYKSGWWFHKCHYSNLNGQYHNQRTCEHAMGLHWRSWKTFRETLKTSIMMLTRD